MMATKERKVDQDQINSIKGYDPMQVCHYRILIPDKNGVSDNEEDMIFTEGPKNPITIWTQHETLALINIYSLNKEQFKSFKRKKGLWNVISNELKKLGIEKAPDKCEIKWKNLLRVYRQHKQGNKGPGKFEFFNELDDIISSDPQFRYILANTNHVSITEFPRKEIFEVKDKQEQAVTVNTKRKCSCLKSDKQKRHEDRMAMMTKKIEIEERKVKAFEDYLKFLKGNADSI